MPEFTGTLRHKLTIHRPSETAGDAVITDIVVASVWGEMLGLGSVDNGLSVQGEYRISIRYRSGLTPRMIFTHGTRRFQVSSIVDPDGRRRELIVTGTEIV